ncbi:MAG: AsmA-like C-terminal domain-containing protein [Campylobacteraceae bacterium]|nr:AsmA-like C-terminal domain-containing protein [Campylobacteraceae bacterium]
MIINATSHTIKNIWIFFLLICVVFVALMGTLVNGIQIDNVTLPKIKISQLYIKLDKKLIVHMENLQIQKETQVDSSLEETLSLLNNFSYLNQFFKEITIDKITYDNEEIKLIFKENIFYLESRHFNINLEITPLENLAFDVQIQEAILKDLHLHVKGKSHLDFKHKVYDYEGTFETFGINGMATINVKDNMLNYHLQTNDFTNANLADLVNFISSQVELDQIAQDWIHKNIVAKSYTLHFAKGRVNLQNFDYYPLEMRASATARDAIVAFEPTVPPAHVDEIGIVFENDTLIFDVTNPTYEKKVIQKANVYIYNLISKGTGIVVDLDAKSKLDEAVHKILRAFKIIVPITQTSGETDANVRLDIKFLPFDINATGKFIVKNSNFKLNSLDMFSKEAEINLDNFIVTLNKTNMRYKNLFDIDITGIFNTKIDKFEGVGDINMLQLDFSGARLLDVKNLKQQQATMNIESNATQIDIPSLETTLQFEPKNNFFSFKDLSKIAALSPFMQENGLNYGSVMVNTENFEKFTATINTKDIKTPLLINKMPLENFEIKLTTDTKTLDANTLNNQIFLHLEKDITLHVKDVNISIPKEEDLLDSPIKITILGENSSFIDLEANRTILSDSYQLILEKNTISLNSKKGKSTFNYEKKKEHLSIVGTGLDDNFTNNLVSNHYFEKGNFSLQLQGKNDKNMHGTFIMQQTSIQDLKFFDNLMATINAIPSLLVFSDPKFTKEGYFVKDGYIEFSRIGDIITITDMKLTGNNADIVGGGTVNYETNQIDLKLKIRTLKTFSNVIDFIPIVGGLILGEDRRISTNINVTGEIEDPKIGTNLILDTIKSPLNIIKRTLELPLEIFK